MMSWQELVILGMVPHATESVKTHDGNPLLNGDSSSIYTLPDGQPANTRGIKTINVVIKMTNLITEYISG
jgi:hypothetical protein